jgi:glutathione S-transferase
MAGVRSDYGIKRYLDETKRLYGVLESRLSKADWLCDKYTLADMANFTWVRGGPLILEIDLSEFPGVEKWTKRIESREAFQRAKGIPPSSRSEAEMLEMFKKMRAKVDGMTNEDKH